MKFCNGMIRIVRASFICDWHYFALVTLFSFEDVFLSLHRRREIESVREELELRRSLFEACTGFRKHTQYTRPASHLPPWKKSIFVLVGDESLLALIFFHRMAPTEPEILVQLIFPQLRFIVLIHRTVSSDEKRQVMPVRIADFVFHLIERLTPCVAR